MATACLRLFTFFPLPDFRVPCLCSCITFSVFERPFAAEDDRSFDDRSFEDVFLAMEPHSLDTRWLRIVS